MAVLSVRRGIALCAKHQTYRDPDCAACDRSSAAFDDLKLLEELFVEVDQVLRYGRLPRSIWTRLADAHDRVKEGALAIRHHYDPPYRD